MEEEKDCDCESLCCPRCQRRLAIARALERKTQEVTPEALRTSNLAPDGYPWEDYHSEDHLL